MKNTEIIRFAAMEDQPTVTDFEEAFYNSLRQYSLRHLAFDDAVSEANIIEALQKSMQVCHLVGINSKHHFKKIYVYDAGVSTMHIDWQMTKKGFNLMVMQIPLLDKRKARWLWKLANL